MLVLLSLYLRTEERDRIADEILAGTVEQLESNVVQAKKLVNAWREEERKAAA
jgi:hypothetical protein